jgi:hypothetical protein
MQFSPALCHFLFLSIQIAKFSVLNSVAYIDAVRKSSLKSEQLPFSGDALKNAI